MRIFFYTLGVLALITSGGMALAHGSGEGSSNSKSKSTARFNTTPPGQTVNYEAPPRMEMVVEGQKIILKITGPDGKPINAESASAKTFVTTGGKISTLHLWPAGGNVLSGKGKFIPDPDMRVEVKLSLPDREPVSKDFYPLRSQ